MLEEKRKAAARFDKEMHDPGLGIDCGESCSIKLECKVTESLRIRDRNENSVIVLPPKLPLPSSFNSSQTAIHFLSGSVAPVCAQQSSPSPLLGPVRLFHLDW